MSYQSVVGIVPRLFMLTSYSRENQTYFLTGFSRTATVVLNIALDFLSVSTSALRIPDVRPSLRNSTISSAKIAVLRFHGATGSWTLATTISTTLILLIFGADRSAIAVAARHIHALREMMVYHFLHCGAECLELVVRLTKQGRH